MNFKVFCNGACQTLVIKTFYVKCRNTDGDTVLSSLSVCEDLCKSEMFWLMKVILTWAHWKKLHILWCSTYNICHLIQKFHCFRAFLLPPRLCRDVRKTDKFSTRGASSLVCAYWSLSSFKKRKERKQCYCNHLMAQLEKFPLDIRKYILSVMVVWSQVAWAFHGISTLEAITDVICPENAAWSSPV